MVKFGKHFRQSQVPEWLAHYIDYKALKKYIRGKAYIDYVSNPKQDHSPLKEIMKAFSTLLDAELKKVYIFFVQTERELYVQINSHLHIRSSYSIFKSSRINSELNELNLIAYVTLNLLNYIEINMTALNKILKKFNKKINQSGDFSSQYIKEKLESKNSDLLYIFQFKIIDEVSALIDDLRNELKTICKTKQSNQITNKTDVEKEEVINSDNEANPDPNVNANTNANDVEIDRNLKMIDSHITKIENSFISIKKIYKTWNSKLKYAHAENENENESPLSKDIGKDEYNLITRSVGSISKENFWNVVTTFFHVWYMGMSLTLVIPITFQSIDYMGIRSMVYSGIIIAMPPLCSLISLLYTSKWIEVTYKYPMISSCMLALLGHLLFALSFTLKSVTVMCVGRALVGFSLNFKITKMYIVNHIPKVKVSRYLLFYKILLITGLASGPMINLCYASNSPVGSTAFFESITRYNFSSWLCVFFAIVLTIVVYLFYVEPNDDSFNAYGKNNKVFRSNSFMMEETITQSESKSFNALNEKLNAFNEQNQYSDTNLVSKSIDQMVINEKQNIRSIKSAFIILNCLYFVNKFSVMFLMSITPFILVRNVKIDFRFDQIVLLLFFIPLGLNVVLYLINFFYISKKVSPRLYLLVTQAVIMAFIICILFMPGMIRSQENGDDLTTIPKVMFIGSMIFCPLLDDTILRLLSKIIPYNYKFAKLKAGTIIEFVSYLGQVFGAMSFLFLYFDFTDEVEERYNYISFKSISAVFIAIIVAYGALMIIELIFLKYLKERPLSRILLSKSKRKIKRTEFN